MNENVKVPKNATASQKKCKRRLVERTTSADRNADEQSKNADRRKNKIQSAGTARNRLERNLCDLARPQTQQRVVMAVASACVQLHRKNLAALHDGSPIDGQQNVAGTNARTMGRRAGSHFGCDYSGAPLDPQHAIFDFVARGALDDVRNRHREQQQGSRDRDDGTRPIPPTRRCVRTMRNRRFDHQNGPCRICKLSKRHTTTTSWSRMVTN